MDNKKIKLNVEEFNKLLDSLKTMEISNVNRALGSLLKIEFISDEVQNFQWSIRIYAPWIIYDNQDALVISNDAKVMIDDKIQRLIESKLVSFKVVAPAYDTKLIFDNDYQLRIFPINTDKIVAPGHPPAWTLDKLNDFIVTIDPVYGIYRGSISNN